MNKEQSDYLQMLADKNGRLTPDLVVADAKRSSSPLHDLFEWNLKKAAAAHWLNQARELIRCVKVHVTTHIPEHTRVVPAFVRDPEAPSDKQGYRLLAKIRDEKKSAAEVMLNEIRAVLWALARAQNVAAALDAESEIVDLIKRVDNFKQHIIKRFPPANQQPEA